ncbi:MAG: 4'-phosphopantetheinyl transferase family protein [Gemmatimonas sp.]
MSQPGVRWAPVTAHPFIRDGQTHVWRIPLDGSDGIAHHLDVLDDRERERVGRFHFPHHGRRYAVAHGALRRILAAYTGADPRALTFDAGEHGKPEFARGGIMNPQEWHFNLSHSGDLALLAVARHGPVGVDVERWRSNVQHLEIAERFFSPLERDALRMARDEDAVLRGFFSTWSRKEAYLKATGHGITRGLFHFDVTMEVAEAMHVAVHETLDAQERELWAAHRVAQLLADRLDPHAIDRWTLSALEVGPGYSGALVTARPGSAEGGVALYESPYL